MPIEEDEEERLGPMSKVEMVDCGCQKSSEGAPEPESRHVTVYTLDFSGLLFPRRLSSTLTLLREWMKLILER